MGSVELKHYSREQSQLWVEKKEGIAPESIVWGHQELDVDKCWLDWLP